MILYCDTSALIKRYIEEEGTNIVDKLWEDSIFIATSVVAYAESLSAFNRKLREGLFSENDHNNALKQFKNDYYSLLLVPLDNNLNPIIEELLGRYSLKGFDSIHLSSAFILKNLREIDLFFACFDLNLNNAAIKEGFKTVV